MNWRQIRIAKEEALRFLERVARCEEAAAQVSGPERKDTDYFDGSKETGALKRSSLDLTRALADMRKSNHGSAEGTWPT